MAARLPDGDPVPANGTLPRGVAIDPTRPFGVYIHIPFCRVRCGYCDFNTYTASELRGAPRADYPESVSAEVALARAVLSDVATAGEGAGGLSAPTLRPASTVFFGGGTPTLLPAGALLGMLDDVRSAFGLALDAEVTVEANPDTVTGDVARRLADGGVTRLSIGMQSAVPHVLAALDREHDPANVASAVAAARDAGLDVSLDLIYGAPGESLDDWQRSLDVALGLQPDHVSAYALIVEEGTPLHRRIRRGELTVPDDDLQAAMYEHADRALADAGYDWYEVSNWARTPAQRSRHNLSYWTGADWWGFGPGAHSHVGGVRWWNVKHPAAYAQRLAQGLSPAAAREVPDERARQLEEVLLRSRIREGLAIDVLDAQGRRGVAGLVADGLIDGRAAIGGTVVLTLRGRLLADAVVRALTA